MKRLNKKGFTLAELLIVIAIIAILIAIAIPAFGGQLENARLQTDHANMRSCYAIAQVAELQGYMDLEDGTKADINNDSGTYYFNADGTMSKADTDDRAYVTVAAGTKTNECKASAFCQKISAAHAKGKKLTITLAADGTVTLGLA